MLGPGEIFTLLFVMLGPLKILGPFAQRTRGLDDAAVRRIAVWSFAVATVAVVVGSLLGRTLVAKWNVSNGALLIAGSLVFLLVALNQLLEQYQPANPAPPEPLPASPLAAARQLVFPIVLTPYGIAAVIAMLSATSDAQRITMILSLVVVVMILDLIAMLFARKILTGATVIILQVIGAVLAVMQVALSVQLILDGLRVAGIITATSP
jgi:multiple antibiotic resistance protein